RARAPPRADPQTGRNERAQADCLARTRLDAHPAVDALQRVDLVAARVLLDAGVRMLARLDVDALRGARRRAEEAGGAADGAVGLERQAMRAPVTLGVRLPLLGVLRPYGGRLGLPPAD